MSKHSFLFELLGQATMTEAYDEHFIFITWKAICKVFDFGVLLLCSFLLVLLCLILFAGSNLCPVFSYQFLSARSSTVSPLCFVWVPVAWILTLPLWTAQKKEGKKNPPKLDLLGNICCKVPLAILVIQNRFSFLKTCTSWLLFRFASCNRILHT